MKNIVLIFAILYPIFTWSQKTPKEIKGDKYFERFSFASAIEKYSGVDGLTTEGKRRLAIAYKNTNRIAESKATLETFINTTDAGAPFPNGKVVHTFANPGTYPVVLITTWGGTFSHDGVVRAITGEIKKISALTITVVAANTRFMN